MSTAKTLRAVEVGTKAGWVVIAAIGAFVLWRIFRGRGSEGEIEEIVPILPPIRPAGPGDAPPPTFPTEPEGLGGGFLLSGVLAQIIDPAEGARVYRGALSSTYKATIEVSNTTRDSQSVQIEVVIDYYEYTGGERKNQRTRFPVRTVRGDHTDRFEVEIDSGNWNGLLGEFGQSNAVALVYTNGKVTQSTSFEVW